MSRSYIINLFITGSDQVQQIRWRPDEHNSFGSDPLKRFKDRLNDDHMRQYHTPEGKEVWIRGTAISVWWLN